MICLLLRGPRPVFSPIHNRIWTDQKAKLIARYLYYFVLITKHGTYIDGFAGPQYADKQDAWTAKLVLESEPRWLKSFFLCDQDPKQVALLNGLSAEQPLKPKRYIGIWQGDFNSRVREMLETPQVGKGKAAFCLVDQRVFECEWATLELIAAKKDEPKIELMYFLGTGWLDRAMSELHDKSVIEKWWGRKDWSKLRGLDAWNKAKEFSERFKRDLHYNYAYAYPIFERHAGQGRIMYFLVHASDHPEAPHLMARAYRTATKTAEPLEQLKLEFDAWIKSPAD